MSLKQVNALWTEDCRRDRDEAEHEPTQAELAILAASLSTGNESSEEACLRLAERALAIWDGAGEALRNRAKRRAFPERTRETWGAAFLQAGLQPPEVGQSFSFMDGLTYLMPKREEEEQVKLIRDHLLAEAGRSAHHFAQTTEEEGLPAEDRAICEMERLRVNGFDYGSFCRFAERFLPWLKNDLSVKRATAGRAGGKKPRAKKKTLDGF